MLDIELWPMEDRPDEYGHGALVADLGLYADIESAIQNGHPAYLTEDA